VAVAGKKPSALVWTEAMSVGVPALDQDHRCLVKVVNLLRSIRDDEMGGGAVDQVLETLKLYGRNHFRREERVMEAIRFPGTEFHKAEHQGFARYIDTLRGRCSGRADPQLAEELFEYLTGWLRHHILIQDMAYKPYVGAVGGLDEVASGAAPHMPVVADWPGERSSAIPG